MTVEITAASYSCKLQLREARCESERRCQFRGWRWMLLGRGFHCKSSLLWLENTFFLNASKGGRNGSKCSSKFWDIRAFTLAPQRFLKVQFLTDASYFWSTAQRLAWIRTLALLR